MTATRSGSIWGKTENMKSRHAMSGSTADCSSALLVRSGVPHEVLLLREPLRTSLGHRGKE